ncbi:MAG: transcription termination factor Rho [Gemmatimonadaceae bacterium]|jgi:transcription termination factor Rho|nr:transcription termination factor Rho [Gemmatimonadaceae bacterium]
MTTVPPSTDALTERLPATTGPDHAARVPFQTTQLKRATFAELAARADALGVPNEPGLGTPELIHRIELAMLRTRELLVTEGVLDIEKGGHGFIRCQDWNFAPSPDDVYVSSAQQRRFGLRQGDWLRGTVRAPRQWEKFLALLRLEAVNGDEPQVQPQRAEFDALPVKYPDERIRLEYPGCPLSMRVVDLFAPIGKGQRGLIVAPPRVGKTIMLHDIATAIRTNHPEIAVIILLIDERPEEVTDFRASVPGAQVLSSTFDEKPERHVHVGELAIERAKRLVEQGKDVVLLLDSITRFGRAHNAVLKGNGPILSGGVDARALQKPKKFFGAARRIAGGGSLTIVATALVHTGSRMDEVIFEEFKGTGNMEVVLDRRIAAGRVFPAIDIQKSGTRRDEMLLDQVEQNRVALLRNYLGEMEPEESMSFLLQRLRRTRDNREFFAEMARGA